MFPSSISLSSQNFKTAFPLIVTRDNIDHVILPILAKIGKTQKEWQAFVRENYSTCRNFEKASSEKKKATLLNLSTFFNGNNLPVRSYIDIINIFAEKMGLPCPTDHEQKARTIQKFTMFSGLILAGIGIAYIKNQMNDSVNCHDQVDYDERLASLMHCLAPNEAQTYQINSKGTFFKNHKLSQFEGRLRVDNRPLSEELKECIANEEKREKEIEEHFTTNLSQGNWTEALENALQIRAHQRGIVYQKLFNALLLEKDYNQALNIALKLDDGLKKQSLQKIADQYPDLEIQEKIADAMQAGPSTYRVIADKHLASGECTKAFKTAEKIHDFSESGALFKKIFHNCNEESLKQKSIDRINRPHIYTCLTPCLGNPPQFRFGEPLKGKVVLEEVNNRPPTDEETKCIETCAADLTAKWLAV